MILDNNLIEVLGWRLRLFAGTASHLTDRNLRRVSLVKLMGKRPLSRPNSRWKDNINKDL